MGGRSFHSNNRVQEGCFACRDDGGLIEKEIVGKIEICRGDVGVNISIRQSTSIVIVNRGIGITQFVPGFNMLKTVLIQF